MKKKLKYLLIPVQALEGWGEGGLKNLADMSTENILIYVARTLINFVFMYIVRIMYT